MTVFMQAHEACGPMEIDSALEVIQSLHNELQDAKVACSSDQLTPLPGESVNHLFVVQSKLFSPLTPSIPILKIHPKKCFVYFHVHLEIHTLHFICFLVQSYYFIDFTVLSVYVLGCFFIFLTSPSLLHFCDNYIVFFSLHLYSFVTDSGVFFRLLFVFVLLFKMSFRGGLLETKHLFTLDIDTLVFSIVPVLN